MVVWSAGLVLLLLGVVGVFGHKKLSKAVGTKKTNSVFVAMIGLSLIGFLLIPGGNIEERLSTLSIGDESGSSSSSSIDSSVVSSEQLPIDTLTVTTFTKYANDYTTVSGQFKVYADGVDPTDPNANPLTQQTISSGTAQLTNGSIFTNKPYYVVFDGSTTYYAKGLKSKVLADGSYNTQTGKATFELGAISTVGTISELNDSAADWNGQSSFTTGTDEIGKSGDQVATYDISVGDASFYFDIEIACSGANVECQKMALCFEPESGAEPEGNEYSSITAQHRAGADFSIPSELVEYFKDGSCAQIGDVKGGLSATYRLTFSASESNMDANDDFKLYVVDLGKVNGKDIANNKGATDQYIDFDHQA